MSQVLAVKQLQMGRRSRQIKDVGAENFIHQWIAKFLVCGMKFLSCFSLRFPKYVTWMLLNDRHCFRSAGKRLISVFEETPQEIIPLIVKIASNEPDKKRYALRALERFKEKSSLASEWVISCLKDEEIDQEAKLCIREMRSGVMPRFEELLRSVAETEPRARHPWNTGWNMDKITESLSLCLSEPADQAKVLTVLLKYLRLGSTKNKSGLIISCEAVLRGFRSHVLAEQYNGQDLLDELRAELEFMMLTADQSDCRIAQGAISEILRKY